MRYTNSQYKLHLVCERRKYLHSRIINYSEVQSIVSLSGLHSQRLRILI